LTPEQGAVELARRTPTSQLAPDPLLPADSRLWAALQHASGGTWGGCVYDVERIEHLLALGLAAERRQAEGQDLPKA
ncbi:MAG: YjhG/YagF family D-xylonate dehydratase, partial [Planctomycetaceae bacterium]